MFNFPLFLIDLISDLAVRVARRVSSNLWARSGRVKNSASLCLEEEKKMCFLDLGWASNRVVESVGEGVEDLRAGDHVVPVFKGECADCAYCRNPHTNLCARYPVDPSKSVMLGDGRTRFSAVDAATGLRRPVHHFLYTSTFAEFTVLDVNCVAKIPPAAPLERMCLLGCGIPTGTRYANHWICS